MNMLVCCRALCPEVVLNSSDSICKPPAHHLAALTSTTSHPLATCQLGTVSFDSHNAEIPTEFLFHLTEVARESCFRASISESRDLKPLD